MFIFNVVAYLQYKKVFVYYLDSVQSMNQINVLQVMGRPMNDLYISFWKIRIIKTHYKLALKKSY